MGITAFIPFTMYGDGKATVYEGLPKDIPSSASTGILWLKSFWISLDSLDPSVTLPLTTIVVPDCQFIINGAPAQNLDHLQESFQKRAALLSEFGHTKYPVHIVDVEIGNGNRVLTVQSTSVSVVKTDPQRSEVKVAESTVIDLITTENQLFATKVVSYLDPKPVITKMQELLAAATEGQA